MTERRVVGIVVARIVAAEVRGYKLARCRVHCAAESFELASLWLVSANG
jgi:hypothetical protein